MHIFFCKRARLSNLRGLLAVSDVEEGSKDDQSPASMRAKRNVPKAVIPVITVRDVVKMSLCSVTTLYQTNIPCIEMQLPPIGNGNLNLKSSPQKQQQEQQQQQSPPVNHTKTSAQQ
jgi:hypothetical protein